MKKRDRFSPPAIGASALLVSFALLVLCVFALLCVSSVQAEARLADASLEKAAAYYAADLQAEELYARLRGGELPPSVHQEGDHYTYTCPITDNQRLEVSLRCENGQWQVLRWQTVSEETAQTDEGLDLWNGNLP